MTYYNYCFTDNTLEFTPDKCDFLKYAIWQKEKGTHEHFQGYIELTRKSRIAALKKLWPTIHFEPRKGTQQQAIDYCKKSDTRIDGPWEFGIAKKPGTRTDLIDLKEYARSGKRKRDVPTELTGAHAKYIKYYDLQQQYAPKVIRDELTVMLCYGPTGSGKTHLVHAEADDLYSLPLNNKDMWFDGYDGHEYVLLDDFSGNIKLSLLLRLLDKYPVQVPIKGGFVNFNPRRIAITSNIHPKDWYKNWIGREEHYRALARRISIVVVFNKIDDYNMLDAEERLIFFNEHPSIKLD